jgi:C-terminal processing protease CtpA/Prc
LDINIAPRSEINYLGPIVVLISASTVSAAETFTMIMDEMPNVTLIGETTHGAFSNVLEWTLPNGFNIGMSNEFYLTPDGVWYEGTGIPVDIEVPFFTREQREQGVDLGIETAAAHLLN